MRAVVCGSARADPRRRAARSGPGPRRARCSSAARARCPARRRRSSRSAAAGREAGRRFLPTRAAKCSRKCWASSSTSLPRARSGGSSHVDDVDAVVEVLAEALAPRPRSRGRGWWRRRCARRRATSPSPPTGRTVRSCSARSSLGCSASGISPISSRNSVPPLACTNRPVRVALRVGEGALGVAEQLALEQRLGHGRAVDGHEGPVARAGCGACSARATSSLPVPLSPVISTDGVRVSATRSMRSYTCCIGRALAEQLVGRCAPRDGAAQALAPPRAGARCCDGALQRQRQRVEVERLGDEVVGAGADGADRGLQAAEGGDHHHRDVGAVGDDALAQLEAAHARHVEVGEHHVEVLGAAPARRPRRPSGAPRGCEAPAAPAPSASSSHISRSSSTTRMRPGHAASSLRRAGRWRSVLPCPGSLLTSIQPPWSRTMP